MPTYSSYCEHCKVEYEYFRKIAECHNTPICTDCNQTTTKTLNAAPQVGAMGLTGGSFSVKSPIDGHIYQGKTEYMRHLKQHGKAMASDYEGQAEHVAKQRAIDTKREIRKEAENAYRKVINKTN